MIKNILSIFYDYDYYKDWIKLAKLLKNDTVKVTYEYNGKTIVEECYEYWDCSFYNGEVSLNKRYLKNSFNASRIVLYLSFLNTKWCSI